MRTRGATVGCVRGPRAVLDPAQGRGNASARAAWLAIESRARFGRGVSRGFPRHGSGQPRDADAVIRTRDGGCRYGRGIPRRSALQRLARTTLASTRCKPRRSCPAALADAPGRGGLSAQWARALCGDQSVQCQYEHGHGHREHQAGERHGEFDADAVLINPSAH